MKTFIKKNVSLYRFFRKKLYMAQHIKIKKGLDIPLKGKAKTVLLPAIFPDVYSICPDDFPGFAPKVAVKPKDRVLAGTTVLYDKNHPEVKIVSPVSGEVLSVNRGEKRKLLSIDIVPDKAQQYVSFGKKDFAALSREKIIAILSETGIMSFIRQRPYDIVANPNDVPRDIFISGFYSAPLAPDFEFILKGQEADFQTGISILAQLTTGKVYWGIRDTSVSDTLKNVQDATIVVFSGPHPAGNAGVQINHIKPINKGEVEWTMQPADVLFIGRLYNKGVTDLTRIIALTGSEVLRTGYVQALPGAQLTSLFAQNTTSDKPLRYISGNVLTGKKTVSDGFLHAFDNQVTVIPEGSGTHEFFGWAMPGLKKFSASRTFFSWLFDWAGKKEYVMDARIKGGKRAIIMSNEYDKVFPMDIFPEFLLKAIIAFDIEKMENLGIYEVAPEDFALCEFVDTSKIEIQQIVRQGLDLLYKEMN